MTRKPIRLTDLFRYYRALPHQNAGLQELEAQILKAAPEVFDRNQEWYGTWSSAVQSKDYGPAVQIIKEFEGCHLNAYLCPAGVPTIGYGNTRYPGGTRVKLGDSISQKRAEEMLLMEIDRTAEKLRESVPYWEQMSVNQKSALISFAFNLGAYFYGSSNFKTISGVLASKEWNTYPVPCCSTETLERTLKRDCYAEERLRVLCGVGKTETVKIDTAASQTVWCCLARGDCGSPNRRDETCHTKSRKGAVSRKDFKRLELLLRLLLRTTRKERHTRSRPPKSKRWRDPRVQHCGLLL